MIFCVEDEQNICELEVYTLQSVGMEAQGCGSGRELFALLEKQVPELIVLDIMLPDEDGVSILRRLRADKRYSNIPVIMATAKGSEFDKVKGLDSGADDYIAKPFGMLEMVARIKAVLRRFGKNGDDLVKEVHYDKLSINLTNYELKVNGKVVDTPPKEMELIYHLASNPNRVFTRDQLLDEVWGFDYYGDSRTVDVHVKRLREKLELDPANPEYIRTKWGVGYYLSARGPRRLENV